MIDTPPRIRSHAAMGSFSPSKLLVAVGLTLIAGCDSGTDGTGGTAGSGGQTSTTTTTGGGGTGGEPAGGGGAGGGGAGGGSVCAPGEMKPCYSGPDGTDGVGACTSGMQSCLANGEGFGPCLGEVVPQEETCSTLVDDDCDGMANEGGPDCNCTPGSSLQCYSGPADTIGVGPCLAGTQLCNDNGTGYGPCMGEVLPLPETCDTPIDDDCDGKVNEEGPGCACPAGEIVDCYTGPPGTMGIGLCAGGQALCSPDGTSLGPCEGEVTPAVETCATPGDDDCDGMVNEEGPGCQCVPGAMVPCYTGPGGTLDVGVCKGGTQICGAQGMPEGPCVGEILPAPETCATPGDEDCDGQVNEDGAGCSCVPGSSKACYTGPMGTQGVGVCQGGMQTCNPDGMGYGQCVGEVVPSMENCNTAANEDCLQTIDCGTQYWAKTFGTTGDQQAYGITRDATDNVYITGRFTGLMSFGGGLLVSPVGYDIFVAKFDPMGNHVYSRRFGDASVYQEGFDVAVDGAGNAFVTGYFDGSINFGGDGFTSGGLTDIFLVKLDAMGNHLWSKAFPAPSPQYGDSVAVDSMGNIVLVAAGFNTVDFGGGGLTSAGSYDIFVAKFDGVTGAHLWSKRFGSANDDRVAGLAVDSANNVVFTAFSDAAIDFGGGSLAGNGALDAMVVKLDPMGNHVWSKRFGDGGNQLIGEVVIDAQNNILLEGGFESTINLGGGALSAAGDIDIYVAKLNAMGNHVWSKRFGAPGVNLSALGIGVDTTGDVAVSGSLEGTVTFGGATLTSNAGSDGLLLRLTGGAGDVIWSRLYGGPGTQYLSSVAADSQKRLYLTGYYEQTIDFGGGPLTSTGALDIPLALVAP